MDSRERASSHRPALRQARGVITNRWRNFARIRREIPPYGYSHKTILLPPYSLLYRAPSSLPQTLT